jgi:hypothetical protein
MDKEDQSQFQHLHPAADKAHNCIEHQQFLDLLQLSGMC